ncbi:hypothetical protein Avbf_16046, partial [Armadillidium vulgare]
ATTSLVTDSGSERLKERRHCPYPEKLQNLIYLAKYQLTRIPPPRVTWWHEGSLLDDGSEVKSDGVTRNTLHMPKLTRADLLKTITCQAVNSNLTAPLTKSVTIDFSLSTKSIKITSTQITN